MAGFCHRLQPAAPAFSPRHPLWYAPAMTDPTPFDRAWVIALAKAAGAIALRHFRRTVAQRKPDTTIVTAADREIEQFLVGELQRRYPADGILGEEGAASRGHSGRLWVLDPLDGTAVFAAGLPIWAISIGLLEGERPLAGVVYLPATGDCFAADLAGPATLNDVPIAVMPPEPYHDETILFGVADAHRAWAIDFPGRVRAFGACAAQICYVARGSGVGMINTHTAIWDIAGALPILERAGGKAVLLDGSPLHLAAYLDGSKLPQPLLAAPPYYLDDLRRRLRYKGG
jgi:myo-inositol-1(or 4)-monophosphatase